MRCRPRAVSSVGFLGMSEYPEPRPLAVIGHLCLLAFVALAIIVPIAVGVAELVSYLMEVYAALPEVEDHEPF